MSNNKVVIDKIFSLHKFLIARGWVPVGHGNSWGSSISPYELIKHPTKDIMMRASTEPYAFIFGRGITKSKRFKKRIFYINRNENNNGDWSYNEDTGLLQLDDIIAIKVN